mmetsp:Transcript_120805/g.352877  ORF Transcript_120805/g.352877 Transcript_120805/m.352877 type:complete len:205 (-) Transcript_120805:677-1291(-)
MSFARAAPLLNSFIVPRSSYRSQSDITSSAAAAFSTRRKGALFFHIAHTMESSLLCSSQILHPCWSRMRPPASRRALAAMSLLLASGSSSFTRPVGCTCIHSRSMVLAPIASAIQRPSPVEYLLLTGRWRRSGRCRARSELWAWFAVKPPLHRTTGPRSLVSKPPCRYAQPQQLPSQSVSSCVTCAPVTIRTLPDSLAAFSRAL